MSWGRIWTEQKVEREDTYVCILLYTEMWICHQYCLVLLLTLSNNKLHSTTDCSQQYYGCKQTKSRTCHSTACLLTQGPQLVCVRPHCATGSTLHENENLRPQTPHSEATPTPDWWACVANTEVCSWVRVQLYWPSCSAPAVDVGCSVRLGELSALPGALRTAAPPSQEATLRIEPERLCAGLPCPSET